MTPVGFEPTPFRNGALSHRLRPLGQSVSAVNYGRCGNASRLKPNMQRSKLFPRGAMARSAHAAHSTDTRAVAICAARNGVGMQTCSTPCCARPLQCFRDWPQVSGTGPWDAVLALRQRRWVAADAMGAVLQGTACELDLPGHLQTTRQSYLTSHCAVAPPWGRFSIFPFPSTGCLVT